MLKHPERLKDVDAELAMVIQSAVNQLPFDCAVAEGVRSAEQCYINWGKGRTAAQCKAEGIDVKYADPKAAKVTWLAHPLGSLHYTKKAVDVYPLLDDGSLDTGKSPHGMDRFDALFHAVMDRAAALKVRVRYGGDWDQDGKLREKGETDSPHFERVG